MEDESRWGGESVTCQTARLFPPPPGCATPATMLIPGKVGHQAAPLVRHLWVDELVTRGRKALPDPTSMMSMESPPTLVTASMSLLNGWKESAALNMASCPVRIS